MRTEKLSRKDIRGLKVGETGIFELPNARAYESARVTVSTVKRLDGMDFESMNSSRANTIVIRRTK